VKGGRGGGISSGGRGMSSIGGLWRGVWRGGECILCKVCYEHEGWGNLLMGVEYAVK
jgi:hypothetical protein